MGFYGWGSLRRKRRNRVKAGVEKEEVTTRAAKRERGKKVAAAKAEKRE